MPVIDAGALDVQSAMTAMAAVRDAADLAFTALSMEGDRHTPEDEKIRRRLAAQAAIAEAIEKLDCARAAAGCNLQAMLKTACIVSLKSGGPCMVVKAVRDDGSADVVWMDREGHLQGASSLPAHVLQVDSEADEAPADKPAE